MFDLEGWARRHVLTGRNVIGSTGMRRRFESYLVEKMMAKQLAKQLSGSVTQSAEDRTFNPDDGGSSPSGPTKNVLIVKKCNKCENPMYIHITDAPDPIFTGCEPCVVDLRLEKVNDHEIVIKGRRSSHQVRCSKCKTRKHLISSFKEVENGSTQAQSSARRADPSRG